MPKPKEDKPKTPEEITTPAIEAEDLTIEQVEQEQKEVQALEDAIAVEPGNLNEEQKEIIRKNADKLPEEQREYYKDVLETPQEPEEEQADPSKENLKKKLSASARENQKIYAKNRVINKALVEANEIPEPTEEELVAEFPEWDVMSDTEKRLAKKAAMSDRWQARIKEASDQATKIEKWTESVDEFIEDPKTLNDNPDLEGKANEFREFALAEANNSVPFNLLVSAFLHEHTSNRIPNRGQMFETGSGGPNEKPIPSDGKISIEEAAVLKKNDYNKYKEYLLAGRIREDL